MPFNNCPYFSAFYSCLLLASTFPIVAGSFLQYFIINFIRTSWMFLFLIITKASHTTGKYHMFNKAMATRLKPISPNIFLAINTVRGWQNANQNKCHKKIYKTFHSSARTEVVLVGCFCWTCLHTFFLLNKEE